MIIKIKGSPQPKYEIELKELAGAVGVYITLPDETIVKVAKFSEEKGKLCLDRMSIPHCSNYLCLDKNNYIGVG